MRFLFLFLFLVSAQALAAAPFDQTFIDLRLSRLTESNMKYYRDRGMGLQTVSIYRKNGRDYAVGSFTRNIQAGWETAFNMTTADYGRVFGEMSGRGKGPRHISVSLIDGEPRYSMVYHPRATWSPITSTHDLTDNEFNDFMFRMAQQGYSIVDFNAYLKDGVRQFSAIFQQDPYKRMYYGDFDKAGIQALQAQKNKENWWIRSLDVMKGPAGNDIYSVIFHLNFDPTEAHFDITAREFKRLNKEYAKKFWQLVKVEAHNGKFSAVWSVSATQ